MIENRKVRRKKERKKERNEKKNINRLDECLIEYIFKSERKGVFIKYKFVFKYFLNIFCLINILL